MSVVLGIDPSTRTGWSVVYPEDNKPVSIHYGEITNTEHGIKRAMGIAHECRNLINEYEPRVVIIEGYGYANRHTLATLVEIGSLIRAACEDAAQNWAEIAPTQLKKFVTNKGTSKKDVMKLETYKRYGFEGTDNEVDAFALAAFGLAALAPEELQLTAFQMEVISKWKATNYRALGY